MTKTKFDPEPHHDERVEWLRAQAESYLSDNRPNSLVDFVHYMEEKFDPRKMFDR